MRLTTCLTNRIKAFIQDEDGQGTLEYIVIMTACLSGSIAMYRQILGVLDKGIVRLGAVLEQDLKTGRMPIDIWKN